MKHMFILVFLMISLSVMAQESIPQDTTIYLNGRKMVIRENNGKIKVKMYEAVTESDTIENTQVFEGVYLDGRSIERTTTVSMPFMSPLRKVSVSLITLVFVNFQEIQALIIRCL